MGLFYFFLCGIVFLWVNYVVSMGWGSGYGFLLYDVWLFVEEGVGVLFEFRGVIKFCVIILWL